MTSKQNFFVFSVFVLLAAGCSSETENQIEEGTGLFVSQSALNKLIASHPLFSGSAIVVQDGEISAVVHTGLADKESGMRNTAGTLHSIASVGKMFTAVAIAQLVEANELTYETSVLDIIPELSGQIGLEITIDHLLHHKSGLDRISNVDDEIVNALRSNADYFTLIIVTGIRSNGPSEFAYRNENYQILGEVIARKSGRSYESYVREYIAVPLAMTGPVFTRRDLGDVQTIANHYLPVDFQTWWNSEESVAVEDVSEYAHLAPPATPSAGGGAYATALDLVRFATGLRNGDLISVESFEANCELIEDGIVVSRGYGRGCLIRMDGENSRVGHTGSTAGVQARFFMYTEKNLDVVVFSNHEEQAEPVFAAIDSLIRTQ